jgi:sugar (pentulose or hexulose) kinase
MTSPATVAVLDVGKSNVKLSAVTPAGEVAETVAVANPVSDGPPWRHHDLGALSDWVLAELSNLARRHPLARLIASGHGSGGILVGDDPDAGDGTVLPMVDYEQALPGGLAEAYAPLAGGFFDRGSAIMMGATHTARQMVWAQQAEPARFARARWLLGIPQYWAWRLTGVPVSEVTILGAQSHLWNVPARRWAPIVAARGWQRLMPAFARASDVLGVIRAPLRRRYGLPPLEVHAGGHDSSLNLYRFRTAGRAEATVLSTGTWLVAMAGGVGLDRLDERRGMTCNADVDGAPVAGALTMGGREFSAVADGDGAADPALIGRLVARGTFALPTFGRNDGQFPGSAGKGRIEGPPPADAAERSALALLYAACLSVACAGTLGPRPLILDGTFLRDPAFAPLVAGIWGAEVFVAPESYGIAAGAALVASGQRAEIALMRAAPWPELGDYARRWRAKAEGTE